MNYMMIINNRARVSDFLGALDLPFNIYQRRTQIYKLKESFPPKIDVLLLLGLVVLI